MSAYGCCGEYNEHAPDCITVKYAALKAENAKLIESEAAAMRLLGGVTMERDKLREALQYIVNHAEYADKPKWGNEFVEVARIALTSGDTDAA